MVVADSVCANAVCVVNYGKDGVYVDLHQPNAAQLISDNVRIPSAQEVLGALSKSGYVLPESNLIAPGRGLMQLRQAIALDPDFISKLPPLPPGAPPVPLSFGQ